MYAGRGAADVVEQLEMAGQTDTTPYDKDPQWHKIKGTYNFPLCTTVMQSYQSAVLLLRQSNRLLSCSYT